MLILFLSEYIYIYSHLSTTDSQLYGYGLMDAGKMVRLGELWRGVPPHHRCTSNVIDVQK